LNFDFGNVLTRAWQITWKHKALWVISALPMILSFLFFPLFVLPVYFLPDTEGQREMFQSAEIILPVIFFIVFAFLFVVSFLLSGVSMSAATLGVFRAERGEGDLSFASLLSDGMQYFGRILGVLLIINLTLGLVFALFFLMVFVLTLVTMGMASICLQPIIILITPLSFLVFGVLESAQAAVVVDDMSALDAVKRGMNIVRENIWKYVILTVIIYVGSSVIMSIFMMPLMAPFFAFSFFTSTQHFDARMMMVVMLGFMCLFFPLMTAFQSVMMTFMKSALFLSYRRLATKEEAPVMIEANA
jgi:hypothetical protein